MKRKIFAATLAAGMLIIFLASCDGERTEISSIGVSSELVSSQLIFDVSSDVTSDVSSDIPSEPETIPSEKNTPPVESAVSVNSEESHEEYGKQINKTQDGMLYAFKKTEAEKNIFTICFYNEQNDTYEVLDQTSVEPSEEWGAKYGIFTDNWDYDPTWHYFYNYIEKRIGFYVCSTGKRGFLPIDDPDMTYTTYFTSQMQYARFDNPCLLGDRICWVETDYTAGEEEDTLYIYDPEADTKTMLYKSDGVRWIDRYWVTGEEMYVKTVKITELSCNMEDWDPMGDLLYYDGEKMTTLAEDICDFKLDENDIPFIKKTEEGNEWEKINTD